MLVGDNVTIGGQVGFAGHIKIGTNVVIAEEAVLQNIKDNSMVAGFPAVDMKEWKKCYKAKKIWTLMKLKKYYLTGIHFY